MNTKCAVCGHPEADDFRHLPSFGGSHQFVPSKVEAGEAEPIDLRAVGLYFNWEYEGRYVFQKTGDLYNLIVAWTPADGTYEIADGRPTLNRKYYVGPIADAAEFLDRWTFAVIQQQQEG